ncbi:MAG: hypothetical protein ACQESV_10125 [Thermodesulfobacteriota bacterium]
MFCSKCKFTSFDHADACPRCGADWSATKKQLDLHWLRPNPAAWFPPTGAVGETSTSPPAAPETSYTTPPPSATNQPAAHEAASQDEGITSADLDELFSDHAAEPAPERQQTKAPAEDQDMEIELDVEDILASLEQEQTSPRGGKQE